MSKLNVIVAAVCSALVLAFVGRSILRPSFIALAWDGFPRAVTAEESSGIVRWWEMPPSSVALETRREAGRDGTVWCLFRFDPEGLPTALDVPARHARHPGHDAHAVVPWPDLKIVPVRGEQPPPWWKPWKEADAKGYFIDYGPEKYYFVVCPKSCLIYYMGWMS